MVRAKVRSLTSTDVRVPLAEFLPPEADNFAVIVTAAVGPHDSDGQENFDIVVCSPLWLRDRCAKDGFVLGRHHLIVDRFDWVLIERTLGRLIENVSGENWREVAEKVARVGQWEFEDYIGG